MGSFELDTHLIKDMASNEEGFSFKIRPFVFIETRGLNQKMI